MAVVVSFPARCSQSEIDSRITADKDARFLAVTPDEAAQSLMEWTSKLDMSKTGQYWAPRGPGKFIILSRQFREVAR